MESLPKKSKREGPPVLISKTIEEGAFEDVPYDSPAEEEMSMQALKPAAFGKYNGCHTAWKGRKQCKLGFLCFHRHDPNRVG